MTRTCETCGAVLIRENDAFCDMKCRSVGYRERALRRLSPRQRDILNIILEAYVNGALPSQGKIARTLGIKNQPSMSKHFKRLEEKGWLIISNKRYELTAKSLAVIAGDKILGVDRPQRAA